MFEKTFNWLDERLGLKTIYSTVLDRKVPKVNWWFTLGSASLFLFLLQGFTGIMLTIYYVPSPEFAYDSIQYIMNGVAFGWLIRGIHHWGSSLMVVVVFFHMLRTFFFGAYKYPREFTWITGVFLLLLTLGMGFTGYLLRTSEPTGNYGCHFHRRNRALPGDFINSVAGWHRPLWCDAGAFSVHIWWFLPSTPS
jgi:quinol-cytochrome oxidoreductase complex cytochrome b subunit